MEDLLHVLTLGVRCSLGLIAARGQGEAKSGPSDHSDPRCPRLQVNLVQPAYAHVSSIEHSGPAGSCNQKFKTHDREAQEYDAWMYAHIDTANAELKPVQTDAKDGSTRSPMRKRLTQND